MSKDFSKFKTLDFLNDDFFIHSILYPNVSSELYWKTLLKEENIDSDAFLSAYMTLKKLHESKPEVPADRIQIIWERIEQSKKQSSKNTVVIAKHKWLYYAAACVITGIAVLFLYTSHHGKILSSEQIIANYTDYKVIYNQEQPADIQITTGANTLMIDGTNADVEYDGEGNLKVNDQIIKNTVNNQNIPIFSQLKVPFGKRAQITLSDSTVLWVNTGSTVIYPVVFSKEKREIFIEGEVYASVMHDTGRPFIIKTKNVEVLVTGTELNITAYNEDYKTDVVLVEGKASVKATNGKHISIQPDQCFSYTDDSCTIHQVDVINYTYWRRGALILKSESVETILLRLARYYNVTMKLPAAGSGITCSGKIELKDDLDEVLRGLSDITSMNFSVRDNTYQFKFN